MNKETKTCQNCKKEFTIEPEDFEFYEKMKVPAPTWCPECRLQRRLIFRNERALYKRKCDLCKNDIIAIYPQNTPFPVYCPKCWYSDKWDALEYGRNCDFSYSLFEQFKELQSDVPRLSLQIDNCLNCAYSNQIVDCKNCYLVTSGSDNEDSMYSHRILNSKDIMDSLLINRGEYNYESIECLGSSYIKFSTECTDSLNISFCYDVRGSNNCFMSSNLRTGDYYFENQKLSKEEWEKKMKNIDLGSYKNLEKCKQQFQQLLKESLHKYANIKNTVNSTGHAIANAKNCHFCFGVGDVEDCSYCLFVNDAKDSFDINNGCCVMELNYEGSTVGVKAYNVRFSIDAWPEITNVSYIDTCRNGCDNLFGCISLRHKQYCILNKQYTKEEYEELVPKIIQHMNEMPYTDKKGRVYKYGEFFPIELSPYAYNESVAQEYFTLSEVEAKSKGFRWQKSPKRDYKITIKAEDLPDNIKDVSDSIPNEVIGCQTHKENPDQAIKQNCTTAFKIIPQELEFYKKMNLPLPRLCPNCRHYQRLKQRNPLKLWYRKCQCAGEKSDNGIYKNTTNHSHHSKDHCPNEFETSYAPDRPEIVYCEECYLKEVV